MGMAGMLGIRAKLFAAQPEQLVYEDFDRSAAACCHGPYGFHMVAQHSALSGECPSALKWRPSWPLPASAVSPLLKGRRYAGDKQMPCRCDLLIAMDDDILGEALAIAGSENDQAWYAPRCTTLTRFAPYCGTAILNPGGTGVLEPELRQIVAPVVGRAQAAQGITRPDLRMGEHFPCGSQRESRHLDLLLSR